MKKEKQHYVIFDIDSSSIGTLVFEISHGKKYKCKEVFTAREDILREQEVDFDKFFNKTIDVFKSLAEKAHKYSGNNITGVFLNVSAPWVSSQKRIIHFEKDDEFIFTKMIEDSIIEKELIKSFHYTNDFRNQKNLSLIERRTLDISANGYPTKNPYGKKVKDVDIHSLISVMSNETKNAFTYVIERAFHVKPEYFSNMFMNYKSITSLFKQEDDVLSIDISGEVTEIGVIIKDKLKKIGSIPAGINHIIRSLSKLLNISYLKAESILIMYQNDELDSKYKQSIDYAMKKSFLSWFRQFYEFLEEASREYIIPSTIHLLSQEYAYAWLSEWILKTEELREHITSQKNISILDTKMMWCKMNNVEFEHIKDDNLALCLGFVKNFILSKK